MKRITKLLCVILTLCMIFTIAPLSVFAANETVQFKDTNNHWAKSYINYWANQKQADGKDYVVKGYADGTFRPDAKISRAEVATILDRVYGFERTGETADFKDVNSAYWAYGSIMDCADNDVINGYKDGAFRPKNNIKRQEAIAMIARCVMTDENSAEFANTAKAKAYLKNVFADADSIPEWAYAEFCFLSKYGNLEGYRDGNVRPEKDISRAEFVKLLYTVTNKDDKVYKFTVTITDNKGGKVSDSTSYLTAESNVLETLVPMIVANRDEFKKAFPSPDMRAIMDEGVAIAKDGIANKWAESNLKDWNNYVEKYFNSVGGADSAKAIFANVNSTIGDMTAAYNYTMTFKDTAEGRTDVVYTVCIAVDVME